VIASDDMAKPTLIEKEVNFLKDPVNAAYSLVVCDNSIIDQNSMECFWGKERRCVYNRQEAKFLTFGNYLQLLQGIDFQGADFGKYENLYLKGNHIPNGYLIRKSILEMTGLYNPKAPLEDYYLMLQLSKYGLFKYIDEPLFCYRWHDFNTIKNSYKITKMAIATEKIEDDILAKINVNDPALLRNVILFKHKYDQSLVYKIHNILRKQKTILKLWGYEIMHFFCNNRSKKLK
jgi:alpha-1,3-rhamnosyltransferase